MTTPRPKTRSWETSARLLGLSPVVKDGVKDDATLEPIANGLAERWATRPVASITAHDVHEFVDEVRTRGVPGLERRREKVSNSQARVSLARLSKFFAWAAQQRLIEKNPCAGVWRPDASPARERVLSDAEIRWFWLATEALGQPFGPLLKLCLLTGQRRDEVAGMTRAELSDDGSSWSMPATRTKNKRAHVVPLPKAAQDLIASVPDDCRQGGLPLHHQRQDPRVRLVEDEAAARREDDRAGARGGRRRCLSRPGGSTTCGGPLPQGSSGSASRCR